ncbi:Hypothetical protein D9617_10g074810 [Elsinoe fawcettii]|nr:Hypothetical protein D9617_10g074810 [Elsinoe fawcettii]
MTRKRSTEEAQDLGNTNGGHLGGGNVTMTDPRPSKVSRMSGTTDGGDSVGSSMPESSSSSSHTARVTLAEHDTPRTVPQPPVYQEMSRSIEDPCEDTSVKAFSSNHFSTRHLDVDGPRSPTASNDVLPGIANYRLSLGPVPTGVPQSPSSTLTCPGLAEQAASGSEEEDYGTSELLRDQAEDPWNERRQSINPVGHSMYNPNSLTSIRILEDPEIFVSSPTMQPASLSANVAGAGLDQIDSTMLHSRTRRQMGPRPKDSLQAQWGSGSEHAPQQASNSTPSTRTQQDRPMSRASSSPPSLLHAVFDSFSNSGRSTSSVNTPSFVTSQDTQSNTNLTRPTSVADDTASYRVKSSGKHYHTWPVHGHEFEELIRQSDPIIAIRTRQQVQDGRTGPDAEEASVLMLLDAMPDIGGPGSQALEPPSRPTPDQEQQQRRCDCNVEYTLDLPGTLNNVRVRAMPDTASTINTMSKEFADQNELFIRQVESDTDDANIKTLTGRLIPCDGIVEATWRFDEPDSLPIPMKFHVISGGPREVIIGYKALLRSGTLNDHKRRIWKRRSKTPYRSFGAYTQADSGRHLPKIPITLNGKEIEAIADTGADANIMSERFVHENSLRHEMSPTDRSIKLADGTEEKSEGVILISWSRWSDMMFYELSDGLSEDLSEPEPDDNDLHGTDLDPDHSCEDVPLQFLILRNCIAGIDVVLGRQLVTRVGMYRMRHPASADPLGGEPSEPEGPNTRRRETSPFTSRIWIPPTQRLPHVIQKLLRIRQHTEDANEHQVYRPLTREQQLQEWWDQELERQVDYNGRLQDMPEGPEKERLRLEDRLARADFTTRYDGLRNSN